MNYLHTIKQCTLWVAVAVILSAAANAQGVVHPGSEAIRMKTIAGATLVTEVSFTIPETWHMQNNSPDDEPGHTELFIEPVDGIRLGRVIYKAIRADYRGRNTGGIFADELKVTMPVITSAQLKSGLYELKAYLMYNACTEHQCLSTETYEFNVQISVM